MELMRRPTPDTTLATDAQTLGDKKRNAGETVVSLVLKDGKVA